MSEHPFIGEEEITLLKKDQIRASALLPEGDPMEESRKTERLLGKLRHVVSEQRESASVRTKEEEEHMVIQKTVLELLEAQGDAIFQQSDVDSIIEGTLSMMEQLATAQGKSIDTSLTAWVVLQFPEVKKKLEEYIHTNNKRIIIQTLKSILQLSYESERLDEDSLKEDVKQQLEKLKTDVTPEHFEKFWKEVLMEASVTELMIEKLVERFQSEKLKIFFKETFLGKPLPEAMKSFIENKFMIDTIADEAFWDSAKILFRSYANYEMRFLEEFMDAWKKTDRYRRWNVEEMKKRATLAAKRYGWDPQNNLDMIDQINQKNSLWNSGDWINHFNRESAKVEHKKLSDFLETLNKFIKDFPSLTEALHLQAYIKLLEQFWKTIGFYLSMNTDKCCSVTENLSNLSLTFQEK